VRASDSPKLRKKKNIVLSLEQGKRQFDKKMHLTEEGRKRTPRDEKVSAAKKHNFYRGGKRRLRPE